jgi:aromatic-L-amino-acid decarboxylase
MAVKTKEQLVSTDSFRKEGQQAIDWIADYLDRAEEFPVLSQVKPWDVYKSLPASAPQKAESFDAILKDVEEKILPGITHWQSPNFYAYFPANSSPASVLGDLLSSGLGVQGMLWATSPACTELETRVLDWIADMLDLPASFRSSSTGGGVIQDSASSANLVGIIAGRERATNFGANEDGCNHQLTAYTSAHAHSSMEKGVKAAGIGRKNLRAIEVDDKFAMRPDALRRAIEQDKKAGKLPCFVGATVGTTSTLAWDPLAEIGAICKEHNIWLHVDAAMELADSYCFDAHKWMMTNFDCTCFYVADRKALTESLTITPEYLKNTASATGGVFDYRDWHIPLGRRFRALKLWCVIRSYGVEGLQAMVRRHVVIAQKFAGWVQKDSRFELMSPSDLNLVCFCLRGEDAANEELLKRLNASGKVYLSHTKLNGRFTLRFCVGQTYTEEHHVASAWQLIQSFAKELRPATLGTGY